MGESGRINQFKKNKGYESIPRDMLQNENLSYAAKGLLSELQSYSDNWKLFKTELYTRNNKDKRTVVERIWDELVEEGYVLQFRKRNGKKYNYEYFFSLEPFKKDEILSIQNAMLNDQFEFYIKDSMLKRLKDTLGMSEDIALSNEQKSLMVWSVENQQSKETLDTSTFFGLLNMDCPKPTGKRFTINREEEDNNKYNTHETLVDKVMELTQKSKDPNALVLTARLFNESGFSESDSIVLIEKLAFEPALLNPVAISEQIKWIAKQSQIEGIYDLPAYFMNGLRKRVESKNVNNNNDFAEVYSQMFQNSGKPFEDVPMHNWVRRE